MRWRNAWRQPTVRRLDTPNPPVPTAASNARLEINGRVFQARRKPAPKWDLYMTAAEQGTNPEKEKPAITNMPPAPALPAMNGKTAPAQNEPERFSASVPAMPKIAKILNMDGSCSDYRVSGVEPVGVVVYIGGDGCGQALALEGLGNLAWSTEYVDIPDLFNYSSKPINDFSSCENTRTVIDYSYKQYGDSAYKYYPAFWQVYNYAPSTMPETKGKWCLPAGGVLNSIYQNKAAIDQSLTRINKENISGNVWSSTWWSSSELDSYYAWYWYASSGEFSDYDRPYIDNKTSNFYVRPVLAF